MIAMIFELEPKQGQLAAYLNTAESLKEHLMQMDGFVSVERFQSLLDPQKYLSLSFWKDEAAVRGWRDHIRHRDAQTLGRESIFKDYRLRVASVTRDYGMRDREQAPDDSKSRHGRRERR